MEVSEAGPDTVNVTVSGTVPDDGAAVSVAPLLVVGVVHVLDVVIHGPHVGPGHIEVLVCVIAPVWPAGHASVCVWGEVGSGAQEVEGVQETYW